MPDDVLTLNEVADYLKVTKRTIYRMVADHKIPAFKVGGSWRFRLVEIDEWIKSRTQEVRRDEHPEGK